MGESLISEASRRYNVNLNIVLANVEVLQGSTLGGMIAVLSGEEESAKAALQYLNENHVETEVLAQ